MTCPLCNAKSQKFRIVDTVQYFECRLCEFIFADPHVLDSIDSGTPLRAYDSDYWKDELTSARERAFGSSLARAAEAILYASRPIQRFVDICCGPGYLLDALNVQLPHASQRFFGIERYPPPPEFRSSHPNYFIGELAALTSEKFQCGVCIEVLEHLTPRMARKLALDLRDISDPDALYVFNTGLVSFVKDENLSYIDPYRRGHITIWSVPAVRRVFEPAGFSVLQIPGKTWAFAIQLGATSEREDIRDRTWISPPENQNLLSDPVTGSIMRILGRESAWAYR
jgi:hypothetical protein